MPRFLSNKGNGLRLRCRSQLYDVSECLDQAVLRQEPLVFQRLPTVDEEVPRVIDLDGRGDNLAAVGFVQQVRLFRGRAFNQEMADVLQA